MKTIAAVMRMERINRFDKATPKASKEFYFRDSEIWSRCNLG